VSDGFQKTIEQQHIARLSESLTTAIMAADFQQVRKIVESEHEENVRAAMGRLVSSGMTGERLAAGRFYIQSLLSESSNRRLTEALAAVGPSVASLNAGLDKVDTSIRRLDRSSSRLAGLAVAIAIVVGLLTLVQVVLMLKGH
jgi:hypothetical protein